MVELSSLLMEDFGKASVPQRLRLPLRSFFLKAGFTEVPYKLFGALFYLSIGVTLFIYWFITFPELYKRHPASIVIFLSSLTLCMFINFMTIIFLAVVLYLIIDLRTYNRTRKVEEVLGDYLGIVSENLKAGMSFEVALWDAIRPEFSILGNEIQLVSKKVTTGEDIEKAINEFVMKYDSQTVRHAFILILAGLKGGGEMADIIDPIVENITETRLLKQELVATNTTYIIFITVIVLLIAPLLFALSHQLIVILMVFASRLATSVQQVKIATPFLLSSPGINPQEFVIFSRIAISTISLGASLIISILVRGDVKGGIRYLPWFFITSLVSFTILLKIITSAFSGIAV